MRFLIWSLGVIVLEMWRRMELLAQHDTSAAWMVCTIFWIFVGAGVLLTGVTRLVTGKMKAGALGVRAPTGPGAPATHKGE